MSVCVCVCVWVGVCVCVCVCLCVCPFLCQKLLLNGWADFLQTWWEGALGWALVSRRLSEPKVTGQRSKVKLSENRFFGYNSIGKH